MHQLRDDVRISDCVVVARAEYVSRDDRGEVRAKLVVVGAGNRGVTRSADNTLLSGDATHWFCTSTRRLPCA